MIKYVKWTVIEVSVGIILTGVIGTLVLGIITGFLSRETIGFVVGILAALILFYSMGVSVESSLDTGNAVAAKRHTRWAYALRMLCLIAGTYAAARLDRFNVVTALLAIFSIKVGVFFQTITHLFFCKWFHLSDELSPDARCLSEEEESEEEDDEDKPDRIDRWLDRMYGKR